MNGLGMTVRCRFHDTPVEIVTVSDPEGDMSSATVRCTSCRSTFTVTAVMAVTNVRFGWPELEHHAHRVIGLPIHIPDGCACHVYRNQPGDVVPAVCTSVPTIARLVGLHPDTVQKWKSYGLRDDVADRVATALGVHCSEIWPDAWAALCANDLDAEDLEEVGA